MYTASYQSTKTEADPQTRRVFNTLFARPQSCDIDFSVAMERGDPGCWFPSHAHDLEQIFFVIEGRMEITIDGETQVIGPREMVYVPRNAAHAGRNAGHGPLEYLVIDHWPRDSEDRIGL
jgi:mannose-6-phosphate isomerase-like protein (cupin superfamily)